MFIHIYLNFTCVYKIYTLTEISVHKITYIQIKYIHIYINTLRDLSLCD